MPIEDSCQRSLTFKPRLEQISLRLRDSSQRLQKEFKGCISLEIRASDEDVRRYLDGHMSQLPAFVSEQIQNLQEEIKTEIAKAVEGMYVHLLTIKRDYSANI